MESPQTGLERRWVLASQAHGRSGVAGEQWGEGGLPLPGGVSAGVFFPLQIPGLAGNAGDLLGLGWRIPKVPGMWAGRGTGALGSGSASFPC